MRWGVITKDWKRYEGDVDGIYKRMNHSIETLKNIFGDYVIVGRKFTEGQPEKRFNRVLFEVQMFFFIHLNEQLITDATSKVFTDNFIALCQNDYDFRNSIEASTKNIDNYRIRFSKFQDLINNSFGDNINVNPFK